MDKLICFGNTFVRVPSIEYFLKKNEKKQLVRRLGLQYYVLVRPSYSDYPKSNEPAAAGYFAPYTITNQTDGTWLKAAINAGHVYLHALDFQVVTPKPDKSVEEGAASSRENLEETTTS